MILILMIEDNESILHSNAGYLRLFGYGTAERDAVIPALSENRIQERQKNIACFFAHLLYNKRD